MVGLQTAAVFPAGHTGSLKTVYQFYHSKKNSDTCMCLKVIQGYTVPLLKLFPLFP